MWWVFSPSVGWQSRIFTGFRLGSAPGLRLGILGRLICDHSYGVFNWFLSHTGKAGSVQKSYQTSLVVFIVYGSM